MIVPGFAGTADLVFTMDKITTAEMRLPDIQTVNPLTYVELEHLINDAYRDLRRYLSQIGYQITQAEKQVELAKADVLFGSYADFMKDKPASKDNGDARAAFFARDPAYQAAKERVAQLKALESHFDGKIKSLEKASSYMKKKMDLVIRSGLSSASLYTTQDTKTKGIK
jgi:hypothetical protein